jgi:DNA-binding response OmpR family regulator
VNMRVLVADRNGRLLESIFRAFAHRFSIQIATTHEHCSHLLRRGPFDLVVISEKLADGSGLRLLGQVAREAPDTPRVFAARRSRLQLLEGRLGPFGLLATLAYPIDPQELLSVLSFARESRGRGVPGESKPFSAAVRRIVERISLTSTDAVVTNNVPMTIMSLRSVPRNEPRHEVPPPPQKTTLQVRNIALPRPPPRVRVQRPVSQSTPSQTTTAPMRAKIALGTTIAMVFLGATLTLDLIEGKGTVTGGSVGQTNVYAIRRDSLPVDLPPPSRPAPSMASGVAPKPVAVNPDAESTDPQGTAGSTPVADPSSFGSEAYEPIYSD